MNNKIKEILEDLLFVTTLPNVSIKLSEEKLIQLKDYITNLQEENERLKDLYRKTCNHLFNIGNDELARYFQAQINECNTFTTQGVDNNEKEEI